MKQGRPLMGAPGFKDLVAADISAAFLNGQEFADTHTIDGKPMTVVVDENELLERDKSKMGIQVDGTYKARRLIYVAKEEYGPARPMGNSLILTGACSGWPIAPRRPVCWPSRWRR